MSLADRLEQGPPVTRKPCRYRRIKDSLPGPEAEALDRMVTDPKWSDAKTYEAMKAEGIGPLPDTDQFLGYHRRRRCDCPVDTSLAESLEE